jgi:hypothetical protein
VRLPLMNTLEAAGARRCLVWWLLLPWGA